MKHESLFAGLSGVTASTCMVSSTEFEQASLAEMKGAFKLTLRKIVTRMLYSTNSNILSIDQVDTVHQTKMRSKLTPTDHF